MPRLYLQLSGRLLGSLLLLASLCGCGSIHIYKEKKPTETSEFVRAKRLQSQMMQFADQYSGVVAVGLEDFMAHERTPEARAAAAFRKVNQPTAAVMTASGPSPYVNLLNMIVLVSLARHSQENYWVAKAYGEPARPLLEKLKAQEADIWNLATNYLSPEQLQELRGLVAEWERKHPAPEYTAFQNFTQFTSMLGLDAEELSQKKGGVFSLLRLDALAGLDRTTREIEQTRYLAERAIYYSQRVPTLLQWRVESLFFNLVATPEIQKMLSMSERWTKSVEQLPLIVREERRDAINQFLGGLANERTNVINNILSQESEATNLLTNLRRALEAGRETSLNVNEMVKSANIFLQSYRQMREKSAPKNNHPFDIREYDAAIARAGETATQLNLLLKSSDQSLATVEQTGKGLIRYAFGFTLLVIVAIVAAMIIYRFLARALFGPKGTSGTAG